MKRIVALILVLSMVLVLCGCSSSNYKKAVDLYEKGNYEEAMTLFEKVGDYEDSEEYIRKLEVLLNPEAAIEAECKSIIDNTKNFWSGYYTLLQNLMKTGLVSSGGSLIYDTKYDEESGEFACLVDIPYMKGSEVYMHYYFGFAGYIDAPNVFVTHTDSIEFTVKDVDKFWDRYWKH